MIPAYQHRWAAPLLDRYNVFILRKSFARIRVANLDALRGEESIIAAPNHSCWWDGCVDLYLSRKVLERRSLLMMGEPELAKHKVFSSLGVCSPGVRYIIRELQREPGLIWLYPQGEMLPARARVEVKPGAMFIAEHTGAAIVPVAHRYEFLKDDHPDVLVRIGEPMDHMVRGDDERLRASMTALLAVLDDDIAHSRFDEYETVLAGAESRNARLERLRE